jgi:flagellar basal-body rod modification protein FlgD
MMATTSAFDTTLNTLGITRTSSSATVQKSSSTTLGQADFLKLMTAQMQNQDPFNPTDNTQMVAQMAQFSQLAGITDMSSTLKAISDKLGATSVSDATAYIGKTVLTEGDTAYGRTSGGLAGAVELDGAATDVNVTISDANGVTLKTLKLGAQPKGTATYDWDGKTDAGTDAGTGPFKIAVAAASSGTAVTSHGLVWAPVQSVTMTAGTPTLSVAGLGNVAVSAVRQIG